MRKIDDIFWILHLAVKYYLRYLQKFCKMFYKNFEAVLDTINFGNEQLRIASGEWRIKTYEMQRIFPHVIAFSKNIISSMSQLLAPEDMLILVENVANNRGIILIHDKYGIPVDDLILTRDGEQLKKGTLSYYNYSNTFTIRFSL